MSPNSMTKLPRYHHGTTEAGHELIVVSDVVFLRDGLVDALSRAHLFSGIHGVGSVADLVSACKSGIGQLVLVDASMQDSAEVLIMLRRYAPEAILIVLGLPATNETVLARRDAGAIGCFPRHATMLELIACLSSILKNKSERKYGAQHPRGSVQCGSDREVGGGNENLTMREHEIVGLIFDGMSNKEIARKLGIEVSTVKSHVHNLLQKLNLDRRGKIAVRLRCVAPITSERAMVGELEHPRLTCAD